MENNNIQRHQKLRSEIKKRDIKANSHSHSNSLITVLMFGVQYHCELAFKSHEIIKHVI